MNQIFKILIAAFAATLMTTSASSGDFPSKKDLEKWKQQREAKGIFNSVKLYPKTKEIEFTYGSPEVRRMSFADFAEFVKGRIVDQTATSAPAPFGYQIEYYSPDGRAYLWYPGNTKTNIGTYTIKESMAYLNVFGDQAGVVICFDYGANSYNPSTGKTGGEECQSAYAFIAAIRGKRQGDVFNLTTGDLPFVMSASQFPTWPDGKPLTDEKAPHY